MAGCLMGRLERYLNVFGDHELGNPLFPFACLLMENCLKLEAFKKKKTKQNPTRVCGAVSFHRCAREREDETEMEVALQSLALETVKPHGRWPPLWIH